MLIRQLEKWCGGHLVDGTVKALSASAYGASTAKLIPATRSGVVSTYRIRSLPHPLQLVGQT